jgi:hypothetical protein
LTFPKRCYFNYQRIINGFVYKKLKKEFIVYNQGTETNKYPTSEELKYSLDIQLDTRMKKRKP